VRLTPTLLNGFTSPTTAAYADPEVFCTKTRVELSGAVERTSLPASSFTPILRLPPELRPYKQQKFACANIVETEVTLLHMAADGYLYWEVGIVTAISLNGISWYL
jgi:hypothetical protein